MADLSPSAQAVVDAFVDAACGSTYKMSHGIAAALRAAADQAVPYESAAPWNEMKCDYDGDHWEMRQWVRKKLLAIAAELENHNE